LFDNVTGSGRDRESYWDQNCEYIHEGGNSVSWKKVQEYVGETDGGR